MAMKKKQLSVIPADTQDFRKANEVIAPRVSRGGTLSLLGRKIFNVLLYHMQRLGGPGVNAPEEDLVYNTLYWLPLSDLAKDSAFNSEDTGLLKETLLKLQDIKIITDDSNGFSSDVLLASVKIIPGKNGKKTMLGWGLHPATEAILRSPEFYTRLSIYYLISLRTTAGMALYENCKRYSTNPSKLTRRESWEWWYDVLTGQPVIHEKPEYKYFKRDVLKPAVIEVNTTDIRVEMIEHKNGRKISELQFRIEFAAQGSLKLPSHSVVDTQLISRISALGILLREAEVIFASNDADFLRATLDLVEARASDSKLVALSSTAAFFRTALRGRFAETQKKKAITKVAEQEVLATNANSVDGIGSKARIELLKKVEELPDNKKQVLIDRFIVCNPSFAPYAVKSPNSRVVREALVKWIIDQKLLIDD